MGADGHPKGQLAVNGGGGQPLLPPRLGPSHRRCPARFRRVKCRRLTRIAACGAPKWLPAWAIRPILHSERLWMRSVMSETLQIGTHGRRWCLAAVALLI